MYFCIIIAVLFAVERFFHRGIKLNKAQIKGMDGEKQVKKVLEKLPNEYILINDVLIKFKDITTQIDHIIICKKGIFVIETKNYSGKIYGNDSKKYWTQKLKGRKNTFYSPVWQNRTHVNAVRYLLKGYGQIPVYSVIVFCGECNIKRVKSNNVMGIKKLKKYLKRFKNDEFIKDEAMRNIYRTINNSNIHSRKIRNEHIKKIKKEYI